MNHLSVTVMLSPVLAKDRESKFPSMIFDDVDSPESSEVTNPVIKPAKFRTADSFDKILDVS